MKEGFSVICLLTLEGVFFKCFGGVFPKRLFLVIFKIERRGYLERREWNKLEGQPSFIRKGYWLLIIAKWWTLHSRIRLLPVLVYRFVLLYEQFYKNEAQIWPKN